MTQKNGSAKAERASAAPFANPQIMPDCHAEAGCVIDNRTVVISASKEGLASWTNCIAKPEYNLTD